ncbi:MAG TPA: DoxX family protein [Burkholderiaceae bacterium]|jgi:uncharacterized membrane protein YphA (DoxX/SURF4 family)
MNRTSMPLLPRAVAWLALLGLCSAYLVGGLTKLFDFNAAVGEMQHFGLAPAMPLAAAVIALELVGPALILLGNRYRWLAALALAVFTFAASMLANRFWLLSGPERFMSKNAFFEHLGLVGAFVLVAWYDLTSRQGDT